MKGIAGTVSATGDYIREAREQKGLTLGQVEEATRIPRYYLEILEGGGDDRLVSDRLYMVHFLRSYATYLEVEVETLAAQFVRENRRPEAPQLAAPIRRRPWRAIVLAVAAALVAAGAGVYTLVPGLVEFEWPTLERPAVVSTPAPAPPAEESVATPSTVAVPEPKPGDANSSVLQPEADETAPPEVRLAATPTAPTARLAAETGEPAAPPPAQDPSGVAVPTPARETSVAAVPGRPEEPSPPADQQAPLSAPDATAAATPDTGEARQSLPGREGAEAGGPGTPEAPVAAAAPEQAATAPADVTGNHTLTIAADEKAWLRVWVDDRQPKDMLLEPGDSRTLAAQTGFRITFGNAGGVRLSLNGEVLPPAGRSGQVVRDFRVPAAGRDTP